MQKAFAINLLLYKVTATIFGTTPSSYLPDGGIGNHMKAVVVGNGSSTPFICGALCDAIQHCFLFCIQEERCLLITKESWQEDGFLRPSNISTSGYRCMLKLTNATLPEEFGISVARNRSATQSSVFTPDNQFFCVAALAVDGNYSPTVSFGPFRSSIAMTGENGTDKLPWWQVDLGTPHLVVGLHIYKRWNNHARAQNIDVRVGDVAFSGIEMLHTENGLCFRDNTVEIVVLIRKCDNLLIGRYVGIQRLAPANANTLNSLNIAEVDVFGFAI